MKHKSKCANEECEKPLEVKKIVFENDEFQKSLFDKVKVSHSCNKNCGIAPEQPQAKYADEKKWEFFMLIGHSNMSCKCTRYCRDCTQEFNT
jgi:hypothetical protein